MWVAKVSFHATQTENYITVAFPCQVFGCIQRFFQSDPESPLDQHRQLGLSADSFEKFKVLRVAGADLKHDSGWVSGIIQRGQNVIHLGVMGHLHSDDLDVILASQFENPGQAFGPVSLE